MDVAFGVLDPMRSGWGGGWQPGEAEAKAVLVLVCPEATKLNKTLNKTSLSLLAGRGGRQVAHCQQNGC